MTKTKSQLRAEAVERLRELNCMDVDCYQLLEAVVDDAGEKVGYRVEIRKLIDLLTDEPTDCQPLDAQARAEIEDAERSRAVSSDLRQDADVDSTENAKAAQDSREKLEEDARELQTRIWKAGANSDGISLSHIIELLDRQAAITRMEDERACHDCTIEQVEALQEQVDTLEAEKRECMEDCANRVSAALVERDRYREKLGRALDAAHEVVRIMEVEQ